MTMRLSLEEVRECLRLLLEHASREGLSEVDGTHADLYWTVTSDEWLVADIEPKPGVGSLHDDIHELKRLLSDPERASAVDIDRLANVLHLLSLQLTGKGGAHLSRGGKHPSGGDRH